LQSIPLHQLQVQELQQLLIATAALQLQPSRGWWEAAAAAVAVLLPCCSVSEQALLLVGLTAGGYQPEQHWWRTWFEETASSCAELEMAAGQLVLSRVQGKPGEPSPQGPAEVSAGTALGAGLAHSGRQLATSSSNTSAAAAAQQGGTARLTAALLLDVLQLLCQLELQPEEAWLAAVLRSHLRWVGVKEAGRTVLGGSRACMPQPSLIEMPPPWNCRVGCSGQTSYLVGFK
jgi:hypothetical protein